MDRNASQPLKPEEAKHRLREAARKLSPLGYVSEHPTQSLAIALLAGFISGRAKLPQALAFTLASEIAPMLFRSIRTKEREL